MDKPTVLDLFGGEGAAGKGYQLAGFHTIGIDNDPKVLRRYPGESYCMDWREGLERFAHRVVMVHASCPCQRYSEAVRPERRHLYPDLIPPVREALLELGIPYVLENVPGSPLRDTTELCGCMFHLGARIDGVWYQLYRPRLFEAGNGFELPEAPAHQPHDAPSLPMIGHGPPGWFYRKHGHGVPAATLGEATWTEWMTREGRREAIPPAFTGWVGVALRDWLRLAA